MLVIGQGHNDAFEINHDRTGAACVFVTTILGRRRIGDGRAFAIDFEVAAFAEGFEVARSSGPSSASKIRYRVTSSDGEVGVVEFIPRDFKGIDSVRVLVDAPASFVVLRRDAKRRKAREHAPR